jgi:hypothetical protein
MALSPHAAAAPARASRAVRSALALCVAVAVASVATAAGAAAKRVFVQKRDREVTSGTSVAVDFSRATQPGNLIVAYVVWDGGGSVSLADTSGNTYSSAVGPTASGDGSLQAQVLYAPDVAGGRDTVTATFSAPIATHAALYVHEYTRLGRLVPLDSAVANSGVSAAMDSGNNVTTRSSSEFLFVAAASNGSSIKGLTRGFKTRAHRGGELTAEGFGEGAGDYQVAAQQSGTGWVLQLVAFQYAGPEPREPKYALGVSDNGRYLVDQNGDPFLITGDSAQSLLVNLSVSQAASFLANRQKKGFNTLWLDLLCADGSGGRPDGSTFDGIRPFLDDPHHLFNLPTPNEAYFSRVDEILRLAAQHGITVLLDPAETRTFLGVLYENGADKARDYGRYLGKRYQGFDNIIWMSGNDFHYTELPSASDDAVVQPVALGIQDFDHNHIHTVELNYLLSGSLDDPSWAPIIQLNASYTYYPTYAEVLKDYNRPNALPTFLVEANYEFENAAIDPHATGILRRQAYWAVLSGATGQMYGNHYTWPFLDGWRSHYNTRGATQMGYVKRLFESLHWWELVPDYDPDFPQSHSVVTAGFGTFSDSDIAIGNNDYVTAARTPDGSLVVAYVPTLRTITVDMSKLAGPAKASWYDPSRGTFKAIAGSPLANSAPHDFTPPGPNRDGDADWVLVLQAN